MKRKHFIGYYNLANTITLASVVFSLASCRAAYLGNTRHVIIFIICAGICDCIDGIAARKSPRTPESKMFGIQLDSLADAINYAVTPVIIYFFLVSDSVIAMAIYVLFAASGIIRLAYFNSITTPEKKTEFFYGVPITCSSFVVPFSLIVGNDWFTLGLILTSAYFYCANIKVWRMNRADYILAAILAVIMIIAAFVRF
jgi:CDP-diacylglycerol--serine O-phosphatidyltransferase